MSSPYSILLKELSERRKWKKIHKEVSQVENTRNEAIKNWEAYGFANQDAMEVWFETYDQSHSHLDEVAKKFGKDSKQYKYNHFVESIALAKITPEGFKPPMSTPKKGAIVAGVAAAAGAAAFVAIKLGHKKGLSPYEIIDIPIEADVDDAIDGTKPQIDVPEDLKEKMAEILNNDDYKKQLADITAQANQKITDTKNLLDSTYSQINDLCANSGVAEKDVTGQSHMVAFNGYNRGDDESLMSFFVRVIENSGNSRDDIAQIFVDGFEERFTHICALYESYGIEDLTVENIKKCPKEIPYEEFTAAKDLDNQTSDISFSDYVNSQTYFDYVDERTTYDTLSDYYDTYLDLMQSDQANKMTDLTNQANGCYDGFEDIVLNYNQAVQDLQQSWLDNNLVQALGDALLNSNLANDTIASNIDFDGNELANKIVEGAKDVADHAAKVAADVLENTFGM